MPVRSALPHILILTCTLMRDIFNHLLTPHNSDSSIKGTKRLFEISESISKATRKFDEFFRFQPSLQLLRICLHCSGLDTA
ncbi:hypothetical protein CEXT_125301 [Caerostris extrusa]|uniref:Uncharacterized protein n=1 Tax=Caerostris extrusa TaxID=172846 RepID=A0AAV4T3C6_CAEEX|nr:hypothetical protein CEXT_125301 [Caerostris extrusa]